MIDIRRILCPVDFSEFARHALDHGAALGRWYGAQLTALHVVAPVAGLAVPPPGGLYTPLLFTAEDLERVRQQVATFARDSMAGSPIEALATFGDVTAAIVQEAARLPADLVVMGTHGRTGFDRLLLGSITEKVLRKSPVPVMTVPCRAPDAVPGVGEPFRRILCPVDFSPSSMRALRFAESLAKEADARLTVMHVVEPASVFEPVPMPVGGGGDSALGTVRQRLEETIADETRAYSDVSTAITTGKPYVEILRAAAERGSELVVLGVHGGRLGAPAFGSTTNHVVRGATCPVLTVRG